MRYEIGDQDVEGLLTEEQKNVASQSIGYSFLLSVGAKLLCDTSWGMTALIFITAVKKQWDSSIPLDIHMGPNHPIGWGLRSLAGETIGNIIHKGIVATELPFRFFSRAIHRLPILPEEDKVIVKNIFSCRGT